MIKEQKSKQKTRLKCILNLTFSSIATQQKYYDSVDLLIPLHVLFFFCNHTFDLCIFIIIFYLMYLIHQPGLMTIIQHTFRAKVFVIQTKFFYFIAQHQTALS